ncbi:MAG: peptide chain release factor N(5)-glutamine methyltransferase [Alphaproteobacteria bacterium]
MATVADALNQATTALAAAGFDSARREARVLVAIALNAEPLALMTAPERVLAVGEQAVLEAALTRRLAGEPASRIRGQREFWSLTFTISPEVLDPRPDTELLVERALAHVGDRAGKPLRILDIGTGSGCILLSLLHELPGAFGVGLDISADALQAAKQNGRELNLTDRVSLVQGSWTAPIQGQFDLIVSNPPYIPAGAVATLARGVRQYDPSLALDGGPDGLAPYRILLPTLKPLLRPSGAVFLEVGAGQAPRVAAMASQTGLRSEIYADLGGIQRCVALFP